MVSADTAIRAGIRGSYVSAFNSTGGEAGRTPDGRAIPNVMEVGRVAWRCWASPPRWNPTAKCGAFSAFSSMHSRASATPACADGGRRVSGRVRTYDGLLLDAGGTLLQLARPVEDTYAFIGRKYGMDATVGEIKRGFKRAFSTPWPEKLRYQGDGKAFWKLVVSEATGCSSNDYFEEVYKHFANGDAWKLPPGAHETLFHLRDAGVKLAVVSNFDTRLRKLLKDLNVSDLFDAIIISSEIGYEKPDAEIFEAALAQIGIEAGKAVHVGDDEKADKMGANAVGIDCWLWGNEVKTFAEIHDRILVPAPQN